MANVLGCDIVVSEFEIQLPYYVHFQTNTLQKGMNPVILPSFVPLLGWLWHSMTYEGWYAIKERNWNLLCMDVQSDIMFRKKTRRNEFEIWKWLFSFKISTRMLFKKARSPFFLLTCSLSLSLSLSPRYVKSISSLTRDGLQGRIGEWGSISVLRDFLDLLFG